MRGALAAAAAGVAFGLFQATNRRGQLGVDAYLATFVLLLVSLVGLAAIALPTQDLAAAAAAPARAFGWFALAGGVHFFLGWTFLSLGQRRLGASRAGVLAGTTPLFGTAVAFGVLGETVRPSALLGVVLVVAGVVVLSLAGARRGDVLGAPVAIPAAAPGPVAGHRGPARSGLIFGLLTALCWAISPVFIRWGLALLPSPLIGVTAGMAAAVGAYGVALGVRGLPDSGRLTRESVRWLVLAGVFVGLGIAGQWIALDLAPVAVVLALNQLAVPVVVLTAPVIVGTAAEPFSVRTLAGGAVVLAGTLVILAARA